MNMKTDQWKLSKLRVRGKKNPPARISKTSEKILNGPIYM